MSPRDQLITRVFSPWRKLFQQRRSRAAKVFRNTGAPMAHRLKHSALMRKRYRVLLLAALVAALVVPVGFALSIDSTPMTSRFTHPVVAAPKVLPSWSMPDAAKLFFVGTVLFGLAAAVRKAS